jgi:hypothetical protein
MDDRLLAWILPQRGDTFLAAFVAEEAADARLPATQVCSTESDARLWVDEQASALNAAVEWITDAPEMVKIATVVGGGSPPAYEKA